MAEMRAQLRVWIKLFMILSTETLQAKTVQY